MMKNFLGLYQKDIQGAINGWDRLRFRGTIRWLASTRGINSFLCTSHILLKDFGKWAEGITRRVRSMCTKRSEELDIPMIYLNSSSVNKEELARKIAKERGIETGDICMFSVVEPCIAPLVKGNRATKKIEVEITRRKCVWIYHYWNDAEFGFGHTRLQTWLPLSTTICLNGRHWLERQLIREGTSYVKDGNCFTYIEDLSLAQNLLNEQLKTNWSQTLLGLLERNCPTIKNALESYPLDYYWSADESEWATDILFRSSQKVDAIFPSLVNYGLVTAQSPTVMRFFGKKLTPLGQVKGIAPKEITSDKKKRYEGVRLKHWMNGNSIKMYNKAGSVLRVETTINKTREFKVFRKPNDDESKPASWQKMRKGVSDMNRRSQVSQACNNRYLEHLAAASISETLLQMAGDICSPVIKKNKRYRAINPWKDEDYKMLQFIARGEMQINGFRNRDLRNYLNPNLDQEDKLTLRKASGRTTRRIRMLRAHALIKKVTKTNRYILTSKGQKIVSAILVASAVDTEKLMKIAA